MESLTGSTQGLIGAVSVLLWPYDAATRVTIAIGCLAAIALFLLLAVPIGIRLIGLVRLSRAALTISRETEAVLAERRRRMTTVFDDSPIAELGWEFLRRWEAARLPGPSDRAPVRFADLLEHYPLFETGQRRSMLTGLPLLFVGVGVFATFSSLVVSVGDPFLSTLSEAARIELLGERVGLALRTSVWGVVLALFAGGAIRWLEGLHEECAADLDRALAEIYPSASVAEVTSRNATTQLETSEAMQSFLAATTERFVSSLDDGLQRIESATRVAISRISDEQRDRLAEVVNALSQSLHEGVESHLQDLQRALGETLEQQQKVTKGLNQGFESLDRGAETHERLTQSLDQASRTVGEAAQSMATTTSEFEAIHTELRQTGRALADGAMSLREGQALSTSAITSIESAVAQSRRSMDEQRSALDKSLGELSTSVGRLTTGVESEVGESLRNIDRSMTGFGERVEKLAEKLDSLATAALERETKAGATRTKPKARRDPDQTRGGTNADLRYAELLREQDQLAGTGPPPSRPRAETEKQGGLSGLLSATNPVEPGPDEE